MDGIFNSETPSFVPETDILGIGQVEKDNFGFGGDSLAGAMTLGLPEETTLYYIEEGEAGLLLNGQNQGSENGHLLLGSSGLLETDRGGDLLIGHTEEMSQLEGEDLLTGGGLAIEKMVAEAVPKVWEMLQGFADKPEFEVEMELAFGNSYDGEKADVLKAALSEGNLGFLPEIEIVNRDLINGANGAFAGETETIYLAREFVSKNLGDVGAIAPVIVEEFGHYIDWEINSIDAPGDEGEIFASFVLGEELSLPEFLGMKVEDDGATVFLDGEMVAIEQANVSWVGGSGDWYNQRKWSGGKVPKSSDNVTVQTLGQRINISFSKGNPNIRDLFLAAKDGGSLTLNGLTTVGNDTDILAEGNNSVVKLPDLKTFSGKDVYQPSSIKVKDGGKVEANKLATITQVDLYADDSKLELLGLNNLTGIDDNAVKASNGGKLTLAAKTISGDVDLSVIGKGSVVNLSRLTAFNGKDVYLPSFIEVKNDGTLKANKLATIEQVDLYVDDSKLELLGLNNLTGIDDNAVKASNGGKLTLAAKTISGDVDITATGKDSLVDLSGLKNFNGKDVYLPSFIEAKNNGTVKASKLEALEQVDLYADNGTLQFSGVNDLSLNGIDDNAIKATNQGKLTLAAKTMSGDVDISAIGKGSVVNLPRLTDFNAKDVYLPSFILAENKGTVKANKLQTFTGQDDVVIKAANQGKLSLGVKTIRGDVDITTTGKGSVVNLPRLTAFNGKDVYLPSFIEVKNDGTLKANKLATIEQVDLYVDDSKLELLGLNNLTGIDDNAVKASNGGKLTLAAKTISGDVDITATGKDSLVDLSGLKNFNGKDVYLPSFIEAKNNGTVKASKLEALEQVDLYADNGTLQFSGVNDLSLNGIDDNAIKATNQGKLTLAAKTMSGDVDISAIGKGSVVNLPKLTHFLGKDVYQPSFILAKNGGKVEASKLKTITNVDPLDIVTTPEPNIAISNSQITEGNKGGKSTKFTVTLDSKTDETVKVNYATANGSAKAGKDYQKTTGTLTFKPGQTKKTITVPILGDTIDESNEKFNVNLSKPKNAKLGDKRGLATIRDNDEKTPTRGTSTAGKLDTSFGGDGIVTTDISKGFQTITSIGVQSDGKIIGAGVSSLNSNSNRDFALVRYNKNGTLDKSFGEGGIVTTNLLGDDNAESVTLQADGKIVVAGSSDNNFAVARYNRNGTLDNNFGTNGIVETDLGTYDTPHSVAVQPNGKIVVAGSSDRDFAVVRYNTNGKLDKTFSGDGNVITDLGSDDDAYSMVLQPDGKIVVAGDSGPGGKKDFAVVRYNSNGSLDKSFSKDGKLTTDLDSSGNRAQAIALQADGKIVVAGFSWYSGNNMDFALARYNPNGSLDKSFSGDGKLTTDLRDEDRIEDITLQADGKIVVAGYSINYKRQKSVVSGTGNFAVARYNSNGTLDASFNNDGKLIANALSGSYASSIALQLDGKIVVAGRAGDDMAVVRYLNDSAGNKTPKLSIADQTITEGDKGSKNATFAVTLDSESDETVKVEYVTADGSAKAGKDYRKTTGTLTFKPGQTKKTITVPVFGDTIDESNEKFQVNLSKPRNAEIGDKQGVATIRDNDEKTPTGGTSTAGKGDKTPNSNVLTGSQGRDIFTGSADSDVFFLAPETKKKAQADRITNFDKTKDFIILGNQLTTDEVKLENIKDGTLIKAKKGSKILGIVENVKPSDLKYSFISGDKPNNLGQFVTFEEPTSQTLGNGNVKLELKGSDGGKFVTTLSEETGIQQVRYVANSTSNFNRSFTFNLNSDGSQIKLKIDGDKNQWKLKRKNNDEIDISLNNEVFMTVPDIPNDDGSDSLDYNLFDPLDPCKVFKQICETVEEISSIMSWIPPLVGATPLTAIQMGLEFTEYMCLLVLGDDQDLADTLLSKTLSSVIDKKLEKIDTSNAIKKHFMGNTLNQFFNMHFTSSMVAKDSGIMESLRKKLGIDWCDENSSKKVGIQVNFQPFGNPWAISKLYLVSPERKYIGTAPNSLSGLGNDAGKTVSLGEFPVGTELKFETDVIMYNDLDRTKKIDSFTLSSSNPTQAKLDQWWDAYGTLGFEDSYSGYYLTDVEFPDDFNDTLVYLSGANFEGNKIFAAE